MFKALVAALAVVSCFAVPAMAERRIALVLGNSAYINVPRLANPANDARLMADTLRSLGFTLVGGGAQLDLDETALRRLVQDFGRALQGADVGLFYYAGHGVQVRGSNYLVPVNANPAREADVDFQMLDANVVLRQMADSGTRLNLVVLDACRNNPFGNRGLRSSGGGLAEMQAPEGTLISFATQPGNVAIDGNEGHSPFSKALAETIRKPGLDLFNAFNDVGLAVKKSTAGTQQPWMSSSPIAGHFYFAGRPPGIGGAGEPPIEPAQPKPEISLTCGALDDRMQITFSDASLSRERFQSALSQLREMEQRVPGACEFGKLFGGPIIKIMKCLNEATYIELGGSAGGAFVMTDSTKNYQSKPARKGQWVMGTTGPPYYCLASVAPTLVLPAAYVTAISVK